MIEPNNPELDTERLRLRIAEEMERSRERSRERPHRPAHPIHASRIEARWMRLVRRSFALPLIGSHLHRLARGVRHAPYKERLRAIPVLGPILRWGWALGRLVKMRDELLDAQTQLAERVEAGFRLHPTWADLEQGLEGKANRADLEQGLEGKANRADLEQGLEGKANRADLADMGRVLNDKATLDELRRLRREVIQLHQKLEDRSRPHVEHASPPHQATEGAQGGVAIPEDFYIDFEDRFRGAPEAIQARQSKYLPVIREAGAGTPEHPVLDIGCGRGEWLQLLGQEQLAAEGVDSNDRMLAVCGQAGLRVHHADALDHLRNLDDDILGAITGFHIAEHIPFPALIKLFDEAWRVLKPGGVLLLETPNPENLQVGAHTFYLDPTHLHPLPPALLEFLAQSRGYVRVEIQRHHPYPHLEQAKAHDEAQALVNQLVFGPQDYALIARKP